MNIFVNNVAVKKNSGGVYTILSSLYDAALEDKDNNYIFLLGTNLFEETGNVKIVIREDLQNSNLKRILFDLVTGKKFIYAYNPDVIVSMQNTAMLGMSKTKQYVYVHQAVPFQRVTKFNPLKKNERSLFFYQYIVGFFIKMTLKFSKNTDIIVQSNWLKNDIINRKIKNEKNIIVSRPKEKQITVINKRVHSSEVNFFYPSTGMIYKNHKLIVDALNLLSLQERKKVRIRFTLSENEYSVLVGGTKPDEISLLGRVSQNNVLSVMKKSTLIFSSYIESYGLPIIEAKALKRPLIIANVSVLKETVAGYKNVKYFGAFNAAELADCIRGAISEVNYVSEFDENKIADADSVHELINIFSKRG